MLNTTEKEFESYYNVTGILIYDPILGDEAVTTSAPVADFVMANKNLYETMKPPPDPRFQFSALRTVPPQHRPLTSDSPQPKWTALFSDNALAFHLTMIPSSS